jgi:hypothetical protein
MGAADRFRLLVESLPDEERQLFESCNNADKLLENVKILESKTSNKGKDRRRYMELTKTFVEALQPMIRILDTFNMVDPMHVASIWGGVRVVLQVIIGRPQNCADADAVPGHDEFCQFLWQNSHIAA